MDSAWTTILAFAHNTSVTYQMFIVAENVAHKNETDICNSTYFPASLIVWEIFKWKQRYARIVHKKNISRLTIM
jgi:hypothetical protein